MLWGACACNASLKGASYGAAGRAARLPVAPRLCALAPKVVADGQAPDRTTLGGVSCPARTTRATESLAVANWSAWTEIDLGVRPLEGSVAVWPVVTAQVSSLSAELARGTRARPVGAAPAQR